MFHMHFHAVACISSKFGKVEEAEEEEELPDR
jgi:hypothetical protein